MYRNPVVAGSFYPGSQAALEAYLSENLHVLPQLIKAVGVVSPHAGYVYSGGVAARAFGAVEVPDTVLLLGPNHTGRGTEASIMSSGAWRTPVGEAAIDEELAQALKTGCSLLKEDESAHAGEHSLEVQIPFILARNPDVRIVPIAFMLRSADRIEQTGREIGKVLKEFSRPVLMVASSDMTHYESLQSAEEKDAAAIAMVEALDCRGLLDVCARRRITMCGVVPTAVMLAASLELGAQAGRRIAYATSGEASGDFDSVVGYAAMVVQ